jgi:hypothetical protein
MQQQLRVRVGDSRLARTSSIAAAPRPPSLLLAARHHHHCRAAGASPSPSARRHHRQPRAAAEGASSSSSSSSSSPAANDAARKDADRKDDGANDDDADDSGDDGFDFGRIADLRAQLAAAVEGEDYRRAAELRDALSRLDSDARLALADANAAFYSAFASGDAGRMARVWADGDHVQVVHPGAPPIAGRAAVDASWRAILSGVRPGAFRISAEDVRVVIAGDDVGVVTCVEVVEADDGRGRTVATNVFERVVEADEAGGAGGGVAPRRPPGGQWRMTLHHGSPMAMGRR